MRNAIVPAGLSALALLLVACGGRAAARATRAPAGVEFAPRLAAASDPVLPGGLALAPRLLDTDTAMFRRLGLPTSPDDPVRICRDLTPIWAAFEQDARSQILAVPPVTPRPGAEAAAVFAYESTYIRDGVPAPTGLSPIGGSIRWGDEFIAAAEQRGEVVVLQQARWTSVALLGFVECRGRAADGSDFHWQEAVVGVSEASLPAPIELRLGEAVAIPMRREQRRGTAMVRQHLRDIREGPEPRYPHTRPVVLLVVAEALPAVPVQAGERAEAEAAMDGNPQGTVSPGSAISR